jgi:hypothetical protein
VLLRGLKEVCHSREGGNLYSAVFVTKATISNAKWVDRITLNQTSRAQAGF